MTDEKIIELFYQRDERAITECIVQYGRYCLTVASGILADSADAEETVSDTWLAAWNSIPPQKPKHLRLYLGRIARNLAIDRWRRCGADRRGGGAQDVALEELTEIVGSNTLDDTLNMKNLSKAISDFLRTEPINRRQVFVRRYFYLEDTAEIATRFSLRETNVRMMLSRTRLKLKKYLIQEGYEL